MTSPHRGERAFATTRWTMVNAAGGADDTKPAAAALAELCEIYWPPLYGYLRGRGYTPEQAQDLTQGFFVRLLETDTLRTADRDRGRFRAFLLTALKRYVINEYERSVTTRRGGRQTRFRVDLEEAERVYSSERRDAETADRIFERKWATIALDRALQRLRAECEESANPAASKALLPYLTESADLPSYRTMANELRMTEGAVKVAVHRLRQRYGSILRAEIAETVADGNEVEAELRELLRAVSS